MENRRRRQTLTTQSAIRHPATDAEILSRLTEVPRARLDAGMRDQIDQFERDGLHVTAYEVAGMTDPAPVIMVVHVALRPSAHSMREAYQRLLVELGRSGGEA